MHGGTPYTLHALPVWDISDRNLKKMISSAGRRCCPAAPLPSLRETAGPVWEETRGMRSSAITGTSSLSAAGAG